MFYLFFSFISMISSTLFSFMKHPLAMGLMLLIQTLLICLISGMITKSFWFSYILFLIFLGGMLVLFIYVTSLASNEMFNFSSKMTFFCFIILIFMFILLTLSDHQFINYMMNKETNSLIFMTNFLLENNLSLNKLYSFPVNLINILLMIYLFLTLIAVVKITNIFEGPLRPNMKV